MLNFTLLRSVGKLDGPKSPVQAARMLTPGATKSGLRISNVRKLGPLDENAATTGDGLIPTRVPKNAMLAVALGVTLYNFGLVFTDGRCRKKMGIRHQFLAVCTRSETPDRVFPFPSLTVAGKSLSMVLAPTVVIHGDTLVRLTGSGPPLPADPETKTPISIAPNAATDKLSL
ncbi:hypothetical protein F8388_005746 [Cannabis sativa]|uniref:Uncharacterized protein n=1 Tax=Cannabis sativa TaxID=3483 RepID=A0A7J6HMH5_CANSA|nr:hypothetical protein F8388_005746 [Cannabis sativa]